MTGAQDLRPIDQRSAVREIGGWGIRYLQAHPLSSLETVGGQVVLGLRTVQSLFVDLVARRFPVQEFVRQAAFMAGTAVVPTLLVTIPVGVTAAILPTVYAEPHPGDWRRSGALAPIDINFKCWIPTEQGIELHFPDYQFGRGPKVITVPWAKLADLIAPEFVPITA